MAFVEVGDGARIHYRLDGPEGGPVLVLSNSLGSDLSLWDRQVPQLSGVRVLRYDTRGHGQSEAPAGPYTAERLAQDVVDLMDACGIAKASFCGISMGGGVGQMLALTAPDRLGRLILANTAAQFGPAEVWNDRIALVTREGVGPLVAPTLERWFTPGFRAAAPAVVERIGRILAETSPVGYAACGVAIRDMDFRPRLATIAAPTLVIGGRDDPSTPPQKAEELAAHIPGAKLVMLDAAHLSCVEQAEAFSAALAGFVAG